MKKSELRHIINEEIRIVLKEFQYTTKSGKEIKDKLSAEHGDWIATNKDGGSPLYFDKDFSRDEARQAYAKAKDIKFADARASKTEVSTPTKGMIDEELANDLIYSAQIRNTIAALLGLYSYEKWSEEDKKEKVKHELLKITKSELTKRINDVVKDAKGRFDFIDDPKVTWRTNLSGAKQALILIKNSDQKNESVRNNIRARILGEAYVRQGMLLKEAKKQNDEKKYFRN